MLAIGRIVARLSQSLAILAAAIVFGCALADATPTASPNGVGVGLQGVRFGGDTVATRVVLDLDAPVVGKLVADESTSGHLVIALPSLLSVGPLQGAGKGLVTAWSISDNGSGARLVLDTSPGAAPVRRFLIPPSDEVPHWRYVIDLHDPANDAPNPPLVASRPVAALAAAAPPAALAAETAPWSPSPAISPGAASPPAPVAAHASSSAPKYAQTAPWAPSPATPAMSTAGAIAPAPRPAPAVRTVVAATRSAPIRTGSERGMKTVVIDAGHGGHDTGAQSLVRNEKDITLAAALSLRSHLLKMGHYRVVMTREDDTFVPLETRVQIARRAGADLFISLHADSAGSDPTPHGASVYTLSDSGQTRVNTVLGPHEWFAHAGDGRPDVRQILLDLTQRSTRNRSSEFAAKLLSHIGDKVDLLPRSHRDAGYFVLLAPDVPAALLEMGFITNPGDEMRLTDPAQREKLTAAIADAIDDYFYGATTLTAGF
jgi:N-acetylmuramoyl-L-alanine amidase